MKEKILNFLKSNLLFSLALNIAIMMLCIQVTSFSYDDINDFYNSFYICHNHFYYSNSINYIFSVLVGSLQYAISGFNCFVLTLILMSCAAFTSITYVLTDKYDKKKALIFSLLLNIIFSLEHYSKIHSSKTAALLLTAGFLLILNAIHNKRYNLPCWIGVIEIAFGSFLNYSYFFVALGFAVAFFIGDLISKKKYKFPFRKFFWYFRPFLLIFVFVTIIIVGLNHYSYSVNHATKEAAEYYEYTSLSESINNLPYPDYNEHKDKFASIGLTSENDYELLRNGYYDSDRSLNNNILKLVSEIQQQENTKNFLFVTGNIFIDIAYHFVVFDTFSVTVIVFLLLSTAFIIIQKRRFTFFPFLYLFTGLIASGLIRYFISGYTYLIYGIWLMMFIFLLYSFNFEQLRPMKIFSKEKIKKITFISSVISIICLLITNTVVFQLNSDCIEEKESLKKLYYEVDRHPDRYYVLDTVTELEYMKQTENYLHPLWGFRSGFLDNVDSFGYFHDTEELLKRSMSDNIYEAVLTNRKIYIIDKNITFRKERYFTKHYAEDNQAIVYSQVNDIDGYKIYEACTIE